ncbi:MAG: sulfotransferase [Pseudomonadota bacterium]|nr:sulfotransferase [Pseudomonadota bacterium]
MIGTTSNRQNIFVMGPARSGTTAITRFLMSHDDVFLADAKNLKTSPDGAPTWESGIFCRPISDREILNKFSDLDTTAPFILEKTPDHVFHLKRILKLFPEAKIIFTHRDPYSCLLSWKVAQQTFLKGDENFFQACQRWRRATEIIGTHLEHPNIQVIEFSDFTTDTYSEGKRLLSSLGLEASELPKCLSMMNDPKKERVPGVVGETVRGGATTLSQFEKMLISLICRRQENFYQRYKSK